MSEIATNANRSISWPGPEAGQLAAGLAVIVIADLLFWQHEPGISLFVFYAALIAAILLLAGARTLTRRTLVSAAFALAAALPLVETPSLAAWLSATFGVTILALTAHDLLPDRFDDIPAVLLRFGLPTPFRFAGDALSGLTRRAGVGVGRSVVVAILKWIVPLVFAGIFVLLFAAANPLIESTLTAIQPLSLLEPWRVILWGFAIVFAWPFLNPRLMAPLTVPEMQGPHLPKAESILFGRGAILRALVVFNAIFAVQTGLDLVYLWGGTTLPDGMSYAEYAHRGAYPLVVTALLAAVFVLAAMRPGGSAGQSPLIRRLVYLFVAQNVLLVVSSLWRLNLYVEVYSLTEFRVAAGIWMGLVAIGLVLIVVRIALNRSSGWLIASNLASLGMTLYICAYVDFPSVIARYNVEHSHELTGQGAPLDVHYLASLGPSVISAFDLFLERAQGRDDLDLARVHMTRVELANGFGGRSRDWQSWTFRDWRLEQYLAGNVAQLPESARTGDLGS